MTKALVLLNTADSQSIPFELAAWMRRQGALDVMIASFYGAYESFPEEDRDRALMRLNANNALSGRAVFKLWRWIHEQRPDVVHIHHWPSGIWGALFGRLCGAAVVKTEHNDLRFAGRTKRLANAFIYPLLDLLICNSEETRRSLNGIERAVLAHKTKVIYNGVDFTGIDGAADRANARAELGIGESLLIGTVGRFVAQKNHVGLLNALARTEANVRLLLIGDGPLRPEVEKTISDLGLSSRVILTGALGRDAVYRHLSALDGFIMPSLWEGFCNAAVEAAGAGLPVLASNIATLREVLGENAMFFDPRESSDMARAIDAFAALNEPERMSLGKAIRDFARGRYAISAAGEAYVHALAGICARRSAREHRDA